MTTLPKFENKFFTEFGEQIVIKETQAFGKKYLTAVGFVKDSKEKLKLRIIQPVFGPTKKNKEPHWRVGNKVYFRIKDIPSLKKILDKIIQKEGLQLNADEKDQLIMQLSKELADAKSVIKDLKEFRKTHFKKYRKEYEKDLQKFNKLTKKLKVTENEVQNFLKDKPIFFGLTYNPEQNFKKIPQRIAGRNKFDFFIEKYDGQSDIIELKRPDVFIFNKDGTIGVELTKAIQQTIRYIEFCIHEEDYLRRQEKIVVNKPQGTIIIGKIRNKDEEKTLEDIEYYFHHLKILTYNQFYKQAKTILENAKTHLI